MLYTLNDKQQMRSGLPLRTVANICMVQDAQIWINREKTRCFIRSTIPRGVDELYGAMRGSIRGPIPEAHRRTSVGLLLARHPFHL